MKLVRILPSVEESSSLRRHICLIIIVEMEKSPVAGLIFDREQFIPSNVDAQNRKARDGEASWARLRAHSENWRNASQVVQDRGINESKIPEISRGEGTAETAENECG